MSPLTVWLAYLEEDAVRQDRTTLGIYTTEAAAREAAADALRDAIEGGGIPCEDPETGAAEPNWTVDTGVEGPFVVEGS